MKILFPIGSFYPAQIGGPNNTIYWIAEELVNEGQEVTVISTSYGIKGENFELNKWRDLNGVRVIYLTFFIWHLPLRFLVLSLKEMRKHDIVVLSSFFYIPSIFIATIAVLSGKKVLWSPRGEFSFSAFKYKRITKVIRLKFVKFLIGSKLVFHATSEVEQSDIRKLFKKNKIYIVPNYIKLKNKLSLEVKNEFIFVGRIHPIKALDRIIIALSKSSLFRSSTFKFNIVGYEDYPGYKKKLKLLINDHHLEEKVIFLGSVVGKEKEILYNKSYFTFLMSYSENFGNVVVESLSQGTPVIASKGTPWEKLNTNGTGFWIDNSVKSIVEVVDKTITMNTLEYQTMRKKARRFVAEDYCVKQNIRTYINMIRNI